MLLLGLLLVIIGEAVGGGLASPPAILRIGLVVAVLGLTGVFALALGIRRFQQKCLRVIIRIAALALVGLLAVVLVGCSRTTPIPPGAQEVHVVITESEVRLDPATVRAGDVYLVLDGLVPGVDFVQRKRTAAETPGPLSDDDLARLAYGDGEGFGFEAMSVGCGAAQRAEDRGQMGPCGNVFKVVLSAGKYALLGPGWTPQETEPSSDPTAGPPGLLPRFMAVLEVLP